MINIEDDDWHTDLCVKKKEEDLWHPPLDVKKEEIKQISYCWFDSYLEINMHNHRPLVLMDLEKRYKVSLTYSRNYNTFMAEINKKKKEEEENDKYDSLNNIKKCLECEKRNKSKQLVYSHLKTECQFINGPDKYKNYPRWIRKIINKDSELYESLTEKSKNSMIGFSHCESYEEFINEFYKYDAMLD
jgi:hypothetical protein